MTMNALFEMLDEVQRATSSEVAQDPTYEVPEAKMESEAKPDTMPTEPAPAEEAVVFDMPPKQYLNKGQRYTLIFQGVCSHCAHCGQPLTDSVSIERGIGPICSKKGYMEDPTNPDEMQAMIDLAEYPDLVDYLTLKYKPQGVRGLMNGLVKICALNRRSPVHQACCDAIESLGFRALASLLRESISIIEVSDYDKDNYKVWVKKSEWSWTWTHALRAVPGSFFSRAAKGTIVPKLQKKALWDLMLKHYEGFCAKVPGDDGVGQKTVKIQKKTMAKPPATPVPPAPEPT